MRKLVMAVGLVALVGCLPPVPILGTTRDAVSPDAREVSAAFDGQSNGIVDQATHLADLAVFDEFESVADGLGPIYNAQSCRECHQNPQSGGGSQVSELRAGRRDADGTFHNPSIPLGDGGDVISSRTLVNDRAICPSAEMPDKELQERVPDDATIRTFRMSLPLFGDGLVEAVPDDELRELARRQCRETEGRICGLTLEVPVVEAASGAYAIGRFGWKDQHASLLSFAADAYLNEMGITSRLQPTDVTALCDQVADPEDHVGANGLSDIDHFARFMRAIKAPPRDERLAATDAARHGSAVFDQLGCATCHVRTLVTAPAGTIVDAGTYAVPPALGLVAFHPFGDFLLHDVGTGDGIEVAVSEHHGRAFRHMQASMAPTGSRLRTAPLWGLRVRDRLMHDGASLTVADAIRRHGGEGRDARRRFDGLDPATVADLLVFLRSL